MPMPNKWYNFVDEYRAYYLSQSELDDIAYHAGFMRITDESESVNKHYYNVKSEIDKTGRITNPTQGYYATYIPI